MNQSDLDPDALKKLKPRTQEEVKKLLNNVESEAEVTIPIGFRNLVNETFEKTFPNTEEEYNKLFSDTCSNIFSFNETFQAHGSELDSQCRDFIDKLIIQLYQETNGKGVGNDFWAHIRVIWNLNQSVSDLDKIDSNHLSAEFNVNQILWVYVQIYELTIHFLTDISRRIAFERRKDDVHSKKFQKLCRKRKASGKTVSKFELSQYFDSQDFMEGWSCPVVQDANVRNKIAHSDYYYDDETKELIFGNKHYELEEFMAVLKAHHSFYCYLIYKCFQESGFIDQFENLAQKKK